MMAIPILLYHAVTDDPAEWIAPYTVTPAEFARHVDLILASGRTAMTVTGLRAALSGDAELPPKPVVLTFDDGFADFVDTAAYLASHGLPSTMYACTGALRGHGSPPADLTLPPAAMLDWSQLPELTELGVEIGAHTHTHPQLDVVRDAVAADEIHRSKRLLEDALQVEVPSFAYPHGFQSRRTRRIVAASGHRSAAAVMNALSSDVDDAYALARLTVRASTTHAQLAAWLTGRGARVAPYPERLRSTAWRLTRRARGGRSTRGVFIDTPHPSADRHVLGAHQPTGDH